MCTHVFEIRELAQDVTSGLTASSKSAALPFVRVGAWPAACLAANQLERILRVLLQYEAITTEACPHGISSLASSILLHQQVRSLQLDCCRHTHVAQSEFIVDRRHVN